MTTYKRVNGDYEIIALNSGTITLDSPLVSINNGNLVVPLGNIVGGNIQSLGEVSGDTAVFSGNISADNIIAASNIDATGNIVVTGNVSATYVIGDGSFLTNITAISNLAVTQISNTSTSFAVQSSAGPLLAQVNGVANVVIITETGTTLTGTTIISDLVTNVIRSDDSSFVQIADGIRVLDNIETEGELIAVGNISGNYVLGNGALLTGVITSVANINSGTSNVSILTPNGNIIAGVNGTANVLVITSTGATVTGTLNSTGNATVGNISATNINGTLTTVAQPNITSVGTLGSLSVSGNVSAGNVTGTLVTGTLTTVAQPNITSVGTLTSLTVTGNITGGNLSVTTGAVSLGSIVNANSNGVGNIGSSTGYFNTVFATSTSALYADVAELYLADQDYAPGTVLCFGGSAEVTLSDCANDHRVAGVVSTNPAHLMNSALVGLYPVKLALVGRVPCRVRGPVESGDILVSAKNGWAQVNNHAQAGRIIGKSLETSSTDGTIEIVVGKH
jgi:hypothetical protein